MNAIYTDLLCLLSCAVNGVTPDTARVQSMEPEKLYRLAKYHSVRGAVCIALERAGVQNAQFHQAYKKAVRKNIFLDTERAAILADFEQQGIWYMPLKGAVLKELYPENGMREMADCDVLYDAERQQDVQQIMLSHGYTAESIGNNHHDIYHKPPVLNFELHTVLFGEDHAEPLRRYYADAKRLLQKDEDNGCGYHLSDEDFYVYMTAHEWKHFSGSGTGIRSLLDCYVFCRCKGGTLDWDYITEQCRQLEIADFEQERRALAVKVFSSDTLPALTDAETEMLLYYLTAGTYGTLENSVKKELEGKSRLQFWREKIFLSRRAMALSVPFTAKSPLLYPAGFIYRCVRVLTKRRKLLRETAKAVKKYGK